MRTLRPDLGPTGASYPKQTMMKVEATGRDRAVAALPTGPFRAGSPDYPGNTVATRRTVVLTEDDKVGEFFINGKMLASANDIAATRFLGQTQEWTSLNETGEDHPVHILAHEDNGMMAVVVITKSGTT